MTNTIEIHNKAETFRQAICDCKVTDHNGKPKSLLEGIADLVQLFNAIKSNSSFAGLIGNGGSASVASHTAIDMINVVGVAALTFHEAAMITCQANDYGYEMSFANSVKKFLKREDCLIAISSSGQSKNIVSASKMALEQGVKLVTFSGFSDTNPLRKLGYLNFWINQQDYGIVEMAHQFLLHNATDHFLKTNK